MRTIVRGAGVVLAVGIACAGSPAAAAAKKRTLHVPNEYPTIQSAIAAAPKTDPVEVLVAAGTYRETLWITGFADVTLTAEPGTTVVSRGGEPAMSFCSCVAASVSGLTLDSDEIGLYATGVTAMTATNVSIPHAGSYGILVNSAAPPGAATIMVSTHYGHPESGTFAATFDSTDLTVDSSAIESSTTDAVRIDGRSAGLHISSSTIGAPQGDGIHADFTGVTTMGTRNGGLDVVDSAIGPTGGAGISVAGASEVRVSGTAVTGTGGAGIVLTSGAKGTVESCDVVRTGGAGIETGAGSYCYHVSGCTVRSTAGAGISVETAGVGENVVSFTGGPGIVVPRVTSTAVTPAIWGNEVHDVGGSGILVTADGAQLSNNVVANTEAAGIAVDARDCVLDGNDVSIVRTAGIVVTQGGSVLTGNSVADAGGAGIVAAGGRVEQNTVARTVDDGIEVGGAASVIRRNSVSSSGGDGIVASGAAAALTGNAVADAKGVGIRADGTGAALQGNRTRGTGGDGVVVGDQWALVQGQTVRDAGADGIRLLGAPRLGAGGVKSNKVSDCAGDGIDLGDVTRCRITRNSVVHAGDCGVRLGGNASANRLTANSARASGSYDLWENDGAGSNVIAGSNRFRRVHRRAR